MCVYTYTKHTCMDMYIYICISTSCIHIYIPHVHGYKYTCTTHTYTTHALCMHMYIDICGGHIHYTHTHVHVPMHIHVHIYVHIHTHYSTHTCMHIYIPTYHTHIIFYGVRCRDQTLKEGFKFQHLDLNTYSSILESQHYSVYTTATQHGLELCHFGVNQDHEKLPSTFLLCLRTHKMLPKITG